MCSMRPVCQESRKFRSNLSKYLSRYCSIRRRREETPSKHKLARGLFKMADLKPSMQCKPNPTDTSLAVFISHLEAHCFKQTLKRNTRLSRNMSTNHHLERSTCSINCALLPSKQHELGTQTER